jgi:Flp pilus assembly protein TadD
MSLINKLLKDLEKQEHADIPSPKLEPVHEEAVLQSKHSHWWIWILVVILVLVVFVFYHYFLQGKPSKNGISQMTALSLSQPLQSTAVATEKSQVVVAAPTNNEEVLAHLQNIIFEAGDDVGETDIDILLDADVHYSVDLANGGQQLLINIENTTLNLVKPLPEQIHNDAISSIKITESQVNQQVKITLNLQPNVELEQLDLLDKPKPRLKLVLFNPDTTGGAATAITPGSASIDVAKNGGESSTVVSSGTASVNQVSASDVNNLQASQEKIISGGVRKAMVPFTSQQQLDRDYQIALNLIDKNDNITALNKLQDLLNKYPDNLAVRETLATLLFSVGNKQEAEVVVDEGLKINPNYSAFAKLKAHILVDHGHSNAALLLMEKAMPDINQDADYYAFMANLYQTQGQSMAAARIYYQLVNLSEAKGVWWVGLGIALESAGKNNAALEAYRKAQRYTDLSASVRFFVESKVQNRS